MTAAICSHCNRETTEDEVCERGFCPVCQEKDANETAVNELRAAVEDLARKYGWSKDWTRAQTGTVYYTLERGSETVVIRIADHATAYCREDFSLVVAGKANADDHTIEQVAARLSQPEVNDEE